MDSNAKSEVMWQAEQVRWAHKWQLNDRSAFARRTLIKMLHNGQLSHAEHYRALTLIDNAYANRIHDDLTPIVRRQVLAPMRVSA